MSNGCKGGEGEGEFRLCFGIVVFRLGRKTALWKKKSGLYFTNHNILVWILIQFGLRIQMLWVEFWHYKKGHSSALFLKLIYLNSCIKSFLKIFFWSVNLLIVSWHQSSTISSLFAPILITMKKPHSPHEIFKPFCANLYRKKSVTTNVINTWNKAQRYLDDTILKDLTPNKIKTIDHH